MGKMPKRVRLLSKFDSMLFDLPRLIELLTAQQTSKNPDDAKTSELVQHFLKANGHDLAEAHRLQDTVSVAYAMYVIHKELRLSEAKGPQSATLHDLLERSSPSLAASSSLQTTSGSP